ncbi:hypothetical protein [Streptomyces finlayi]|uniref:Sensor domain-containing protein n=1 Tax=Streptomyces finlayi TaxID=67296 RepID=A0A7G7BGN9_9ACTN|nr:hypothetical protein [Streptomyces finlayi]QNE74504.1 hypothetical protein F0344_07670 [Streptomyces finlayi]
MRVRVATALSLTAITVLALPACSAETTKAEPSTASSARTGKPADTGQSTAPLASAALEKRLLDESDLGSGYLRKPERPSQHDDVTVVGCPALNELGGDAATGGSLDFPRQAKATFTYTGGSNSEISEELYSNTADKLSDGIAQIFDAMTGCPTYQVISGSTTIDMASQKMTAPQFGDEQWSQLLTFSAGGQDTVVKQTAIRDGSVLLVVSGPPALVDRHLAKALTKAAATS